MVPILCDQLPRAAEIERQHAGSGVKFAFIIGQDDQYQQQTLACQRYASQHGITLDRLFIDHDGQRNQATTFNHVYPYPDAQGAVRLPFNLSSTWAPGTSSAVTAVQAYPLPTPSMVRSLSNFI